MKELIKRNRALTLFFLITLVLSAVFETMIIVSDSAVGYLLMMWSPAVAALIAIPVRLKEEGRKLTLKNYLLAGGFRFCNVLYVLLGCLLPLVYLLIPYLVYWAKYPDNFAYSGVAFSLILTDIGLPMLLGTVLGLLSALGEEIGWRGFMVPELYKKLGLEKTLLISSLIWCLWHMPILLFGGYMEGTPMWYQAPAFLLCILPVGIMAGLLAIKTKSMWPAAFLHAAHNNYDQAVFGVITRGDDRMFYVSETGILTIVCAWALAAALYFAWRKKLPPAEKAE